MDEAERTQLRKEIEEAVSSAFAAGIGEGRYMDVSRVPLICQSIVSIEKKLDQLVTQQEFQPVRIIAYGLVGTIMTGVLLAILMLVLKH